MLILWGQIHIHMGLFFSEYVFSWGSQNAISTSREARVTFVNSVSIIFITLFRSLPKLIDWKSIVLLNTKRVPCTLR